jgi:hypothetical protein
MTYPRFEEDIAKMNERYELVQIPHEWMHVVKRLEQFADILDKEFAELADIEIFASHANDENGREIVEGIIVQMADLLGDIVVYCASEARRWGIPLPQVLELIMLSNESKLGADGKPIKDANDKFEKGPNYWKPEPAIEHLLRYGGKGIIVNRGADGIPRLTLEVPESAGTSEGTK